MARKKGKMCMASSYVENRAHVWKERAHSAPLHPHFMIELWKAGMKHEKPLGVIGNL